MVSRDPTSPVIYAPVAQLVERRIEAPGVGGSNPPWGTSKLWEIRLKTLSSSIPADVGGTKSKRRSKHGTQNGGLSVI